MLIDQSEIDSLLNQADGLAEETMAVVDQPKPPPKRRELKLPDNPEIRRILRVRVPAIVRLAHRLMPVRTLRKLAPGSIIEFEKSVDEDLDLLINARPIGSGTCVKAGEHFGLRLTKVEDATQRIKSLGP